MAGRMRININDGVNEYQRLGRIVSGNTRNCEYTFDEKNLGRESKADVTTYFGQRRCTSS